MRRPSATPLDVHAANVFTQSEHILHRAAAGLEDSPSPSLSPSPQARKLLPVGMIINLPVNTAALSDSTPSQPASDSEAGKSGTC